MSRETYQNKAARILLSDVDSAILTPNAQRFGRFAVEQNSASGDRLYIYLREADGSFAAKEIGSYPLVTGPDTGITTGTGTICETSVTRKDNIIETEWMIDLTGLNSGGTAGDIIGKADTANCSIGRWVAAENGTALYGTAQCLEVPAGGDPNIDLFKATVATGTEDAAVSGLTGQGALLESSGDWTLALTQALSALPAANDYLYLVAGDATNATYTAGKFRIVIYGYV